MKESIETARLMMRKHTKDNVHALYPIFSNPITMKFWETPFTMKQVEGWIDRQLKMYQEYGFGRYAVILKETGEIIGDCGVMVTEIDGRLENDLGYIFHYPFWGMGYATEAATAWKNYAFDELNLDRFCANMAYDHEKSRRVAEKIGLKLEREFHNKRNRDLLTFLFSNLERPLPDTD